MSAAVIRTQAPDERPAVREVVTAAFGDPVVGDLVERLQDGWGGADGLSFVAELEGRVVGHVLVSRSWLDAPRELVEVLVLSPLSVASEYRRRGIGARLVDHAVREAAAVGPPLLFLEGSPRYYGRLGFERAGARGFTSPSVRIPDAAFQVVVLPSYEPWMTGALVYAEAFWALDCVGLRNQDPSVNAATSSMSAPASNMSPVTVPPSSES